MSSIQVGSWVWMKRPLSFRYFEGEVMAIRRTIFGKRYFLRWECQSLDTGYTYEKTGWRMWWRIFK